MSIELYIPNIVRPSNRKEEDSWRFDSAASASSPKNPLIMKPLNSHDSR